jgi:hypothetical protein
MGKDDEDAVAEFIRSKGITRCPTACSSPTQATLPPSDRNDLKRHAEAQEAARLARPSRWANRMNSRAVGRDLAGVPNGTGVRVTGTVQS